MSRKALKGVFQEILKEHPTPRYSSSVHFLGELLSCLSDRISNINRDSIFAGVDKFCCCYYLVKWFMVLVERGREEEEGRILPEMYAELKRKRGCVSSEYR